MLLGLYTNRDGWLSLPGLAEDWEEDKTFLSLALPFSGFQKRFYLFSIQKLLYLLKRKGFWAGAEEEEKVCRRSRVNDDFVILNDDPGSEIKMEIGAWDGQR
jgi:hypothetical protein